VMIQHLANLPSICPADSSSFESCISALESSISALESSLRATEGSAGNWETFGWLCAVAVGIGIAGEIVVIVSEHREGLQDWRRGILRPPDRPPSWRFWFDILATLVVLGGVFGEARATGEVASINSQLRSKTSELRAKSDQLLAVITEEAGDAATSAKSAKESAAIIGQQADILKAEVRRLIWLGPRDLLLLESRKPFKPLKRFAGQKFRFSTCKPDLDMPEGGDAFASEVGRTIQAVFRQLHDTGWNVVSGQPLTPNVPFPYINNDCGSAMLTADVSSHTTPRTAEAAEALQSILNDVLSDHIKVGMQASLSPDPGPDVIDIHVGAHPAYPAPILKQKRKHK